MKLTINLIRLRYFNYHGLKKFSFYFSLTILICAIILASLFYYELNLQKQYAKKSLNNEIEKTYNLITQHFDQTYRVINSIIRDVKKSPSDKKYVDQVLSIYKTNPLIANELPWTVFSWTDKDNQIIADTIYGLGRTGEFDISKRDYIQKTQKIFGKFVIGKPVIGVTSKKWVIPAGVGVAQNGEYLGTLAIGFDLEVFANLVRKEIKNNDVKFTLIDYRNKKVFSNFDNKCIIYKESPDAVIRDKKIIEALNKDKEEVFFADVFGKEKSVFLLKKSQDYDFAFLMEFDKEKLRKKLFESYFDKIKILGLIAAIIIFIFFGAKSSFH